MFSFLIDARSLGQNPATDTAIFNTLRALPINESCTYTILSDPSYIRSIKLIRETFECLPSKRHSSTWIEWIKLLVLAKKYSFDLVHILYPTIGSVSGKNTIVSLQNIGSFFVPKSNFFTRFSDRIKKQHIKKIIQKAIAITVESEQARRDFGEFFRVPDRNIHVISPIPNPLWNAHISEQEVERTKKIYSTWDEYLLANALEWGGGNAVRLLKAFAKIARQNEKIRLIIFGKEWVNTHAVRESIISLELRARVGIIGEIPEEDQILLSRGAVGLIYTNLYRENTLPILQANILQLPLAYSAVWALENIDNSPLIFPFHPLREESIFDAITELLQGEKFAPSWESTPQYEELTRDLDHLYKKFLPSQEEKMN